MFLNHTNTSSSLMGQSYSSSSEHEPTTKSSCYDPTSTSSSTIPPSNRASTAPSSFDEGMNYMSNIPSSLFLSPITSNDSAYHVDHDISPVSSPDSLETVVQPTADPITHKRVKSFKNYLSRKFKKDDLAGLKHLSLNDPDNEVQPHSSLSQSLNSLKSSKSSKCSDSAPSIKDRTLSHTDSFSIKSSSESSHLANEIHSNLSHDLYVIQSNDDTGMNDMASSQPKLSSSRIYGNSPERSSTEIERPHSSKRFASSDDLQSSSRRSSSHHLSNYTPSQPRPTISRRSPSHLYGYSPSKTPIKSPDQSLLHSRRNSSQYLSTINPREKSSRNNSSANLKNTFKLHPDPNDPLNPIDTLLNQSRTNLSDNYVPSILSESLKIWDTSNTPDNVSVAETVESKVSDDYFPEPEPVYEVGNASPLLSLPLEILYRIIEIVYHDDQIISINSNLENFSRAIPLLTRRLNQLSLCFLYKYAIFNRPHAFDKFLTNLHQHQFIGKYVEFMDFQQFTSVGLGRTGRMNQEIQMVTSRTITEALSMTPNLVEFMASENIQDDMDVNVLDYLFNRLYKIQTIDFCGASSEKFVQAFRELIIDNDVPAASHKMEPLSPTLSPILSPITSITSPAITPTTTNNTTISPVVSNNEEVSNTSMETPKQYEVHIGKASSLNYLFKLSFHDCTSLTSDIFIKILPHLHNIRRLDLNHTSITSAILNQYLPHTARLTHLSLSRCSKLTTKDLINFLTQHPAVAENTLQWLNLQIDSNVVSPLSDIYLNYTLKHLKGSRIVYLNIGGLPIKNPTMKIIKNKFPQIESLSIAHASLTVDELNNFMKDNTTLRYLDISGVKLSRSNILSFLKTNFYSSLEAIELDYKVLYELTSDGEYIKVLPEQQSYIEQMATPQVWKFYDNEGRRAWIYKLSEDDPSYKDIINGTSNYNSATTNLVYYDLETGNKITTKMKSPKFLKYASRKINCSIGYMNLKQCASKKYLQNIDQEDVWPVEFSQRGIYNYYSLNVK